MDRRIGRKRRRESRVRFNKHCANSRQTHRSQPANTDDVSNTEPAAAYISIKQATMETDRQTERKIETESRARVNKHCANSRQTHRSQPANTDDVSNID